MLKKSLKISLYLLVYIFIVLYENIDYKTHSYMIDNVYKKDISKYKIDYIGYIEIDKLNIKREIKLGINDYNLLTHVAMNDNCANFDCNNIILAGHSIKSIFANLKNIKVNDNIKLFNGAEYNYIVQSIDIVDKKNTNIIDNSNLILITCYDFNRRIIVKAKRI